MKRCPSCNRTYTDVSLNFCLEDGTPLVNDGGSLDPGATLRYTPARDTSEPPPTEIYRPDSPATNQPRSSPQPQQWAPVPPRQPQWTPGQQMKVPPKKSNAIWWVLGGVVVVGILGIGLVVMLVVLASIANTNTNGNANSNSNSNVRVANLNSNSSNSSNTNSKTSTGSSLTDDFSEQKWGTGNSKFGEIWYADGEYHMRSKKDTYLVMYAPTDDYKTGDATVKVTARSVDGTAPSAGFGLIVNGEQSKTKGLEDYALLIFPGDEPAYEVIMHKDGAQVTLVPKTPSKIIRSGTNPNQLEVRIKGADLAFYANGQYLTRITDSANLRNGLAGFYTSDTTEVAFDDLEIKR